MNVGTDRWDGWQCSEELFLGGRLAQPFGSLALRLVCLGNNPGGKFQPVARCPPSFLGVPLEDQQRGDADRSVAA